MPGGIKITFAGAADTVTGSRHLVEADGQTILLDCGLFQGFKTLRLRNWAAFPMAPRRIDAVVLSHAHLDHSGYLPVLVREGFRGPIYCTAPTRDLVEIMLLDSAHLLEEEARHANQFGYSKHQPAEPLYTVADVRRCLKQIVPLRWGSRQPQGVFDIMLQPAGHLLGASIVTLMRGKTRLVYSGDLGRDDDLLMAEPKAIEQADVLLIESTYGNRLHPKEDVEARLAAMISQTAARGGTLLMPAFAVGRAQALMLAIQRLKARQAIPDLPVYLDSPMAQKATRVHRKHEAALRISRDEVEALCEGAEFVTDSQASMALAGNRFPSIIIAGSGMATGGRILHHLKSFGPDARHHIVFPGFQVPGTRGAKLVAGDRQCKIHGQYVQINAQISQLEGLSGHADQAGLLQWSRHFRKPPAQVFVVHGEREAADALRSQLKDQLGWPARTVEQLESEWV